MVTQHTARHPGLNRIRMLLLALAVAMMALAASSFNTVAQEQMIDFRIFKVNCEEAPGDDIPPISEALPEGCTYAEGVDFTVFDTEGTEIASCTTDDGGLCIVQVPNEANVVVEEDEATADDGYVPLENPIETQAVTEFAGAIFVNVREDGPTTELPDTGSGTVAQLGSQNVTGALVVVAMLLAAGGLLARRPGAAAR